MALAKLQQAAARVTQCLEDPLISAPFPEETAIPTTTIPTTMTREEFLARVDREQAIARFKCEQELVRLDTELAKDEPSESFDTFFNTTAVLAPLRILSQNLMHIELNSDALMDAATHGHTYLVDILLAYVTPCVQQNAPLRYACQHGHLDTVRCLLADKRTEIGAVRIALRIAVQHGHANIVRELLDFDDDDDDDVSDNLLCRSLTFDVARELLVRATVQDSDILNIALSGKVDILRLFLAERPDYVCGPEVINRIYSLLCDNVLDVIRELVPFVATDSWSSIVVNFVKNDFDIFSRNILRLFLADKRFDPSVNHNLLLKHKRRIGNAHMVRELLSDTRVHAADVNLALSCACEGRFIDVVLVIVGNMTKTQRSRAQRLLKTLDDVRIRPFLTPDSLLQVASVESVAAPDVGAPDVGAPDVGAPVAHRYNLRQRNKKLVC